MPIHYPLSGVTEDNLATPYVNQGGSPTECNVYLNDNGTAVQVHSVGYAGTDVIDDFEHDDLWAHYSNHSWSDPGEFDITTAWSATGSRSLQTGSSDGSFKRISSFPASSGWNSNQPNELPNYPTPGDNMDVLFQTNVDVASTSPHHRIYFAFGASGTDNIGVNMELGNGNFWLRDRYANNSSSIASIDYAPAGSTLRLEIDWWASDYVETHLYVHETDEHLVGKSMSVSSPSDYGIEWRLSDEEWPPVRVDGAWIV